MKRTTSPDPSPLHLGVAASGTRSGAGGSWTPTPADDPLARHEAEGFRRTFSDDSEIT